MIEMAFFSQFILRQQKNWSLLRTPPVNVSVKRFCQSLPNQTTDVTSTDNPLIQEAAINQESRVKDTEPKTFEELFKKSAFVSLGNPKGKIVVGTIKRVVEDSLYIDFGWKFHCVCPTPTQGSRSFVRGTKVRIMIKELELATKFLGSHTEITLNEADCVLLGLYNPSVLNEASKSGQSRKMTEDGVGKPLLRESISELFVEPTSTNEQTKVDNKKD